MEFSVDLIFLTLECYVCFVQFLLVSYCDALYECFNDAYLLFLGLLRFISLVGGEGDGDVAFRGNLLL